MRTPSSSSSTTSKTTPCCSKDGIKRGPWTPEEDEILADFVRKEGEGRWRTLPKLAGLQRCGKSCRLRWMNYLRPSVKRGRIGDDEEDLILRLHRLLGNRWSLIAGRIPGRTDNEIKNYWNTHLSKKLIRQGIDPRTHKPLTNNINANNAQKAVHGSNTTSNPHHPASQISTISTPAAEIGRSSNQTNNNNAIQSNWKPENNHTPEGHISNWNWPNCDGNDDKITDCGDDVFSSFLDSLINDNGIGNQQLDTEFAVAQSQQLPISSSMQSFNLAIWEAEIMKGSLNNLGEEVEQYGSRKDSYKPAN